MKNMWEISEKELSRESDFRGVNVPSRSIKDRYSGGAQNHGQGERAAILDAEQAIRL